MSPINKDPYTQHDVDINQLTTTLCAYPRIVLAIKSNDLGIVCGGI